jgi:hypothetical protein
LEEYGTDLEYVTFNHRFPLNYSIIAEEQKNDNQIQEAMKLPGHKYKREIREGVHLYVTCEHAGSYIPALLQVSVLQWYHTTLQHPGIKRMQATMRKNLNCPEWDSAVEHAVQQCPVCQQYKITTVKQYGKIPLPKSKTLLTREEVHVDMISPRPVQFYCTDVPGKSTTEKIQALTVIEQSHRVA